jgi:adenosylhomocysteine nucleosidase
VSVLVVTPTRREAAALGRAAFVCGSAGRAAESVALRLRESHPSLLIIAGVCGGLDPSLGPGSLILGRRLLATGRRELTPDPDLLEAARRALRVRRRTFVSSTLLSVAQPVGHAEEKRDIWNAHGAAGIDMETYEIAAAAEEQHVPWLALRAVLDPAAFVLPASVLAWRDEQSEQEIVRRMLRRPLEWPAYVRLAIDMRRALRGLRQGLPALFAAASASPVARPEPASPSRVATRE